MSEFGTPTGIRSRSASCAMSLIPPIIERPKKNSMAFLLGIGDLKENREVIGDKARKVSPRIFDEHQDYYRNCNTIGFAG